MNAITLRQLRYFEAVARLGQFGRAANACAVTQPALSMQIKDLEETLGATLFERNSRHVSLTAYGTEMLRRVRGILRDVDDLAAFGRGVQLDMISGLRLGMIPTVAPYVLPAVVTALAQAFPRMVLHVRETMTAKLLVELADGRIDAALVALPISDASLVEKVLFAEPFLLVRPAGDKAKPLPSPAMLREMRLLLLEEGHCFRDQALAFCRSDARTTDDLLDASSLSTLVQMVAAGIGVTLIPGMAVAVETRAADVDVRSFDAPGPSRTIGMVWRKSSPLEPHFLKIAEVVGRAASAQAGRNLDD
jgi:LysR family transcriptional regulator, hydrogen peroxide-inducible genes activator